MTAVNSPPSAARVKWRRITAVRKDAPPGWCYICLTREADESHTTCGSCRFDERLAKRVNLFCEDCQMNVLQGHSGGEPIIRHRWDCPSRASLPSSKPTESE